MKKSIKTNYIYNLLYQTVVILMPLVTTPYLSRVLGPDGVGTYSYLISIVTYFILFGSLGTALYGQREIAYNQDSLENRSKIFFELLLFRLITMIISIIVFYITFARSGVYSIYYRILLVEMVASIIDVSWFYYGMENFKKIAIRNTIIKVLAAASMFIFIKNKIDINIYLFIYSISALVISYLSWIGIHKYITIPKKINIFSHTKKVIYLFIPQIAIQVYTVLDKTMIGAILNDMSEVGNYEQSQKVIKAMLVLITGVTTVMMPRIASYHSNKNKAKIAEFMSKTFSFVLLFAIPLMFGIIAVSSNFAPLFFGSDFDKASDLMKILSFIIVFIALSNITGNQYLLSVKKEKYYSISVLVGAIVNFVLNYILIRCYKSYGAAIATVIAEISVTTVQLYYIRKDFSIKNIFRSFINYFISGIIMFAVCYFIDKFIDSRMISMIVQIGTGVIVYFGMLFLLKDKFLHELLDYIKKEILKK